ncbi:hypothetical protein Cgig2_033876 [Carnegiea gigantea]|uniref:Retrotransposon gag domain-containing protein n=1 Tax=Carnegiea gigantea TaxID=171969 RepID=A0A9Q1Q978_9CARY|nr:hypothetical protein Cgig2_033876 [Carnegiea gigantea]
MEMGLSTKRKLVFKEFFGDLLMILLSFRDNCYICAIVLYVQYAHKVWLQLGKRFYLSNGLRKYILNREVYFLKQDEVSVFDYHTKIKCIWEELGSIIDLPHIIEMNDQIVACLRALVRQQEESSASFSEDLGEKCSNCGNKGHENDKFWEIIGYPSWHPRIKKFPQKKPNKEGSRNQRFNKP